VLDELTNAFKFNDAVIRNLIIRRDEAITEESILSKNKERDERRAAERRPERVVEELDDDLLEDEIDEDETV
jgi:small subunit ribosomal protein S6